MTVLFLNNQNAYRRATLYICGSVRYHSQYTILLFSCNLFVTSIFQHQHTQYTIKVSNFICVKRTGSLLKNRSVLQMRIPAIEVAW